MTTPRCHCGSTLSESAAGFTCPRCHRTYADGATLPACKHARTERVGGDPDLMRVRCRDCRRAEWTEVPISEGT